MVTTASPDIYRRVIEYGLRKTSLRFDRLLLQAFMAGVYIGMAGQACNIFAGGTPEVSKSVQKFMYASIFPTAFIAIIFTGAELFTGNTMTMLICLIERRITILHLIINWVGSFIGNWLGTLFSAYFLSYIPGDYNKEPIYSYICYIYNTKTNYSYLSCIFKGIGCNTLVCLAVWMVIGCDDYASKILSLWFPIVSFCIGGYEHIIANMYTLQLSLIINCPNSSLSNVIIYNFIPTLIGNIIGGCVLIGAVYWYNFYPIEDIYSDDIIHTNNNKYIDNNNINNINNNNNNNNIINHDFPISRVHSRASVSPSIIGLGAKQTTAFGGAAPPPPPSSWHNNTNNNNNINNNNNYSESISNVGSNGPPCAAAAAAAAAGAAVVNVGGAAGAPPTGAAGTAATAAGAAAGAAAPGTAAAAGPAFNTNVFPKPKADNDDD